MPEVQVSLTGEEVEALYLWNKKMYNEYLQKGELEKSEYHEKRAYFIQSQGKSIT